MRVVGSSSYQGQNYIENDLKGNENCFELAGGSSYRGFELLGGDFTSVVEGNHSENSLFFDWNPQIDNTILISFITHFP